MPRRSSKPAASSGAMDTLTLGTLTRIISRDSVETVLHQQDKMHKIDCKLPAPFLVYFVIALGLQMQLSTREVLRWLLQGMKESAGRHGRPGARRREIRHLHGPETVGLGSAAGSLFCVCPPVGDGAHSRRLVSPLAPDGPRWEHLGHAGYH